MSTNKQPRNKVRITSSRLFLLELVRVCLQHPAIPEELRLRGLMSCVEMKLEDEFSALYLAHVLHPDTPEVLIAEVRIVDTGFNSYVADICTIYTHNNRERQWKFSSKVINDKIVVTPVEPPSAMGQQSRMIGRSHLSDMVVDHTGGNVIVVMPASIANQMYEWVEEQGFKVEAIPFDDPDLDTQFKPDDSRYRLSRPNTNQ